MTERSAEDWIRELALTPHPEGGYFRETYRAADILSAVALPDRFTADRACSSAIYYLLKEGTHSVFHRIRSDEVWHFYAGGPLLLQVIHSDGGLTSHRLGETLQVVVPAGAWMAAAPLPGSRYALVGCTVSPAFDFADYEQADTDLLAAEFPAHRELIGRYA
ncbi:MAG: cupin domain-containing protein [Verrucomicrobia bacterium]|nr:cupin domain-containing protein [Verrucomicrobiota bacterium]